MYKTIVTHKDKEYEFHVPDDFSDLLAPDAVEVLLKLYAAETFVNPVYAIITGSQEGPCAVGVEPSSDDFWDSLEEWVDDDGC